LSLFDQSANPLSRGRPLPIEPIDQGSLSPRDAFIKQRPKAHRPPCLPSYGTTTSRVRGRRHGNMTRDMVSHTSILPHLKHSGVMPIIQSKFTASASPTLVAANRVSSPGRAPNGWLRPTPAFPSGHPDRSAAEL
jgi:hypothetical protein